MVPVRNDFIAKNTKRRSGEKIKKVSFIVIHDTGNSGSTAKNNVDYYKRSANDMSASAHVFVDDKEIVKCIPLNEKAWHVRYNVYTDDTLFGANANDEALGIELCYDRTNRKVNNREAYQNFVEYTALLCNEYKLTPSKHLVGHSKLDPARKTDPENAFRFVFKDFTLFVKDVEEELKKYEKKD
jgi:N-acetylmuramoyl-L-alanine amidase